MADPITEHKLQCLDRFAKGNAGYESGIMVGCITAAYREQQRTNAAQAEEIAALKEDLEYVNTGTLQAHIKELNEDIVALKSREVTRSDVIGWAAPLVIDITFKDCIVNSFCDLLRSKGLLIEDALKEDAVIKCPECGGVKWNILRSCSEPEGIRPDQECDNCGSLYAVTKSGLDLLGKAHDGDTGTEPSDPHETTANLSGDPDPLMVDTTQDAQDAYEEMLAEKHDALVLEFRAEQEESTKLAAGIGQLAVQMQELWQGAIDDYCRLEGRISALEQKVDSNERCVAGAFDTMDKRVAALESALSAPKLPPPPEREVVKVVMPKLPEYPNFRTAYDVENFTLTMFRCTFIILCALAEGKRVEIVTEGE